MTKEIQRNAYRFLKAEDISPKDDTFHGNINLVDIEWWYFDAVFSNGYSIHVGFRIYHLRKFGIIQSSINLYKDGKTVSESKKINLFNDFKIDADCPCFKIADFPVVTFDKEHYKKTGEWRYIVDLKIDDAQIDLTFVGTTSGWKIETKDTCWVVPLPKAKVKGAITINNSTMDVEGIGYHDHNWSYSITTAMNNHGWYWGRIAGEKINMTWAKTIQNKEKSDLITVLNLDKELGFDKLYFNIDPQKINFTSQNFEKINGQKVPKDFKLKIFDEKTYTGIPINIDIQMKTADIQYQRIFTIKYYRYHVIVSGNISVGPIQEEFKEKSQIIEFLNFKSKSL